MNIQNIRRANLRALIQRQYHGVARHFSLAVDKPEGQINDMLADPPRKAFGERIARQLETLANIPRGYLDDSANTNRADPSHQANEPAAAPYQASRLSPEAIAALFIVCSAILFSAAAIIMAIHRHQLKMMESFSRVMTIMEYQPPATTSAPPPSPPQDWVAQAKAESVAAQR